MRKLILLLTLVISTFLFSQKSDYEKVSKYLDSLVSKADTIYIVFTKEINFVQSEVPIYEHQIYFNKFKRNNMKLYDTLKDGRMIYKKLPGEFNEMDANVIVKKKQPLIFENDYFRNYNQPPSNYTKKLIGYEKRTCLNNDNRAYEIHCGGDSFYKFVFYHSYIKPEFQDKYLDYISKRDVMYKHPERYSGFTPVIESGAVGFLGIKIDNQSKNLLFSIDTFYSNFRGEHKYKTIMLQYLESILKKDKVYYLKTGYDFNLKEDVFEKVTYQKYILDY